MPSGTCSAVSCDVQSLHLLTLVYLDNQHCFFKSIFSEYSIYTDNYVCRLENLGALRLMEQELSHCQL